MKILKRILLSLLVLVALLLAYPAYLLLSGKVVIGDLDMLMSAVRGKGIVTPAEAVVQQRLQAPPGMQVTTWARDLPQVRFLRMTRSGDVLASRPRAGELVLLLADRDGDGYSDGRRVILSGLKRPHGIDFYQDWLYVAESDAVGRIRFDHASGRVDGDYQRILTGIGDGGAHWTKSLRIADDGWIYLSSGSTCNVCVEEDKHRAAISRLRVDGSDYQVFASGLRNSVGLDFNPADGQLYATDNGRDLLGDDIPPCELNRIVNGGFYGFPYRYGNNEVDPDYGTQGGELAQRAIPQLHGFRAHNAPLGIHFLRQPFAGYPAHSALVALHGSWNRSKPDGYKVVALRFQPDGRVIEEPFLAGFEQDGNVIGRPVDVVQGPDGSIYVSDDYAGAIYRVAAVSPDRAAVTADPATSPVINPGIEPGTGSASSPDASAGQLLLGQQVWQRNGCSGCHGAEPGAVAPKVLKNLAARYDQATLAEFFLAPTPPMPRLELSDAERQAVAAWLLAEKSGS